MKKKVIDIFPPGEIEGKGIVKKVLLGKKPQKELKKPEVKISLSPIKKGLIFVLFIFILAGFFCSFFLSRAKIEIWPEVEILTLKTKLTVDKTAEQPDFLLKLIPGEIFEKEKNITENFPATGKTLKEKKAEGTIRVYNEYSTSPQVLIATTRFISVEGKLFRTPIRITIPGGHYEEGKFVPGEIDIKVVADQPGSEYNIGPSTFSIPGFAGSDRYTKFYAKSFQSMTGGFSEEVSQVTKADLEEAEKTLTKKAKSESETSLKNELKSEKFSSEFYFLEEGIQTETIENFSLNKVGDEVENFNFQAKAKSKTLIFRRQIVEDFAKEFILSQIAQGNELYEESLRVDFTPETINITTGKIILSLEISAKIYPEIDTLAFKNNLKEKSLAETKVFLENQPGITKAKVEFWPFWIRKVPEDIEKIEFKLMLTP